MSGSIVLTSEFLEDGAGVAIGLATGVKADNEVYTVTRAEEAIRLDLCEKGESI